MEFSVKKSKGDDSIVVDSDNSETFASGTVNQFRVFLLEQVKSHGNLQKMRTAFIEGQDNPNSSFLFKETQ